MKKILWICSVLLAMVSCQEDYELNTDFAVPTELSSPASIQLNVSSPTPVVLSWSGGGAADGGIVLYEVLFDKADGDFSKPLATMKSDLGAIPVCRLLMRLLIRLPEMLVFILWEQGILNGQ